MTRALGRRYRKQVISEHAFGSLRRHGIRQAKYFGARKAAMQLAFAAMAANPNLAVLGLGIGRPVRALLATVLLPRPAETLLVLLFRRLFIPTRVAEGLEARFHAGDTPRVDVLEFGGGELGGASREVVVEAA
jgi:hypothetical protein